MTKRLSAVTGEYNDKQTGQQKAEWTSIGVMGLDKNGKEYLLLDPSVSLSGVLAKQNVLAQKRGEQPRDMVMTSVFENDSQQSGFNQQSTPNQQGGYQQQAPAQQGGFNAQNNQPYQQQTR